MRRRVRWSERRLGDLASGARFAGRPAGSYLCAFNVARYELRLSCYPGQEARFSGKRRNLELTCAAIDGVVVRPGEILSFWQRVGRPTRRAGYVAAAALRRGALVEEVGGSICLASTVIYNAGLLSGLTVVERYCHSMDTYGEDRYFELGRDAAVEFPYRDLRLRNDLEVALRLRVRVSDAGVRADAWSDVDPHAAVELVVSPPSDTTDGFEVHSERIMSLNRIRERRDLGWSTYRTP